jgi:hypothetical protein
MPPKVRFAIDSALEGEGFEPSVPVRGTTLFATMVTRCPKVRFASNSLLEGARFEPSVPPQKRTVAEATKTQPPNRNHSVDPGRGRDR